MAASPSTRSHWHQNGALTVAAWAMFGIVLVFSIAQLARTDFRHQEVLGDSSAYLLQAESLAYQGHNLSYDQRDLDRFRSFHWAAEPSGLYFQRYDKGWAFAKPYGYSVWLAPFLRAFGPGRGVALGNAGLLVVICAAGGCILRLRYSGVVVPVTLTSFVFGSHMIFYAFHIYVELFLVALAAVVFAALLWGLEHRNVWATAIGIAAASFLVTEKAPALLLVGPIGALAISQIRSWRARISLVLLAVVVFVVAITPYLHYSDHKTWNPYGGERYYATSGVPFGSGPGFKRVHSEESFSVAYARSHAFSDVKDKGESSIYYLIGRHTGLLPFMPLALLVLIASVLALRRPVRAGVAILVGIGAYAAFYVVLFPHNYNGGGQTLGNRYFLQVSPAILALAAASHLRWRALLTCAVVSLPLAGVFMFPHYQRPFDALRDLDTTSAAQRALPFETNQTGAGYFRCGRATCPPDHP